MTDATAEARTPDSQDQAGKLQRLGRSNVVLFLAWFALILILKWPTLTQPPVWDSSMSVFPAAITLADNHFDLGYLLDQPGYADGGPNVHSISLVTWFTAAVIAAVGDGPALFPILHLIHFAVAAGAMTAILRFAELVLSPAVSIAVSVAVLVFPLVLTQAGYMYLEFPLLAATALALLAWTRGNFAWAAVWVTVAAATKESGIIVGVALALATLVTPGSHIRRWRTALLVTGPAFAITAWIAVNSSPGESSTFVSHVRLMTFYLLRIPDLLWMVPLFALAMLVNARRNRPEKPIATRAFTVTATLVFAFIGFYVALPLITSSPVVPRYFIQIVPFMLIGLFAVLERGLGAPATAIVVGLVLVFFAMNSNGRFYPDNTVNIFALLERSGAYVGLLELQQEGIAVLEGLDTDEPIFYAQPEHYKFTYPLMGYAKGPLENGHSIRHEEPYKHGRLEDFPDEFYMLYEFPWLGGEIIRDVRDAAEADPDRWVEVVEIVAGEFRSQLLHVTRKG